MSRLTKPVLAALALLILAACASQPVYGPRGPGESAGYTDERLAENRFRVTYTGNAITRRETVEDFLLYRAAEVTVQSGFTHFVFDTRDTQARTSYYSSFIGGGGWPGWGRHRGYGWYWHSWPYDTDITTTAITRYEAYAEIVMLMPDQAKQDPHSLDANEILANLGPRVHPPAPPAH